MDSLVIDNSKGMMPGDTLDNEYVVAYLKLCAVQCNPRKSSRRLSAIRQWHKLQSNAVTDPTQHLLVAKTMRGIARLHGKPCWQFADSAVNVLFDCKEDHE